MQCQICNKNEATIHLTEINKGQRVETHICEQCAQEKGIIVKTQMPINELLSNLLSNQGEGEDIFTEDKQKVCPECGFTMDQFHKEALLGCPHDYEVFENELTPLIKKAHDGNTLHCGKVPQSTPKEDRGKNELMNLNQQLQDAVKSENYELAAKLRDRIQELEVN